MDRRDLQKQLCYTKVYIFVLVLFWILSLAVEFAIDRRRLVYGPAFSTAAFVAATVGACYVAGLCALLNAGASIPFNICIKQQMIQEAACCLSKFIVLIPLVFVLAFVSATIEFIALHKRWPYQLEFATIAISLAIWDGGLVTGYYILMTSRLTTSSHARDERFAIVSASSPQRMSPPYRFVQIASADVNMTRRRSMPHPDRAHYYPM